MRHATAFATPPRRTTRRGASAHTTDGTPR
jgi:hypothetical protein